MRNINKILLVITVFTGISAISPAYAANDYFEVVEIHSASLRENEKVEARIEISSISNTNSFQDVIEKNRTYIRSQEIQDERLEIVESIAPTGYLDVVHGNKS